MPTRSIRVYDLCPSFPPSCELWLAPSRHSIYGLHCRLRLTQCTRRWAPMLPREFGLRTSTSVILQNKINRFFTSLGLKTANVLKCTVLNIKESDNTAFARFSVLACSCQHGPFPVDSQAQNTATRGIGRSLQEYRIRITDIPLINIFRYLDSH